MKTLSVTDVARNFSAVLDALERDQEEIVLVRIAGRSRGWFPKRRSRTRWKCSATCIARSTRRRRTRWRPPCLQFARVARTSVRVEKPVGWLIDTSIWIAVERGTLGAADIHAITRQEPVYLSPVSVAEIRFGLDLLRAGPRSSEPPPRCADCAANRSCASPWKRQRCSGPWRPR